MRRRHHPLRVMPWTCPASTLSRMEWVALMVWVLVAGLALPVGVGALSGAAGLGLQAVAAIAGVVFTVLFIIRDGAGWAGWLTVAMAVIAVIADVWGADVLLSDGRPASAELQGAEEVAAGTLGFQLPLLGVALLCSLCLGLHFVTLH
jgi:hypothetical protein